jgi:tetratricopeptide (TPR) repeat protein
VSARRRRGGLLLLVAAGVVLLAGAAWWLIASGGRRAGGSDAAAPEPVPAIRDRVETGRPVVLLGLDGADWELLDRYIADGDMPHLAALRARAVWGELRSEEPMLSPLLWTTMMTGVSPLEHRILDFTRRAPETGTPEPIPSSERRRPALWNMAAAGGLETAVYGLWATWPAEPVRGVLVSDRLFSFLYGDERPPAGVAYPPAYDEHARAALRRAETAVDFERLRWFLPWLEEERARRSLEAADPHADPVAALRRILIQTEVYARLALERLAAERPDLTVLYLEGTDAIGHVFAPFAPPRMPEVSESEFERFSEVPRRYHRFIDDLVGEVVAAAARRDAAVMVVSDHGFHWRDRPRTAPSNRTETAVLWHRPEGLYLLAAPGVEPRRLEQPAGGIRQVASTVLALLGLPPGSRPAGPPLPGVEPRSGAPVDYLAHYAPPPEPGAGKPGDMPGLEGLRALGYLAGGPATPPPAGPGGTMTAAALSNEGRLLQAEGRHGEAEQRFRRSLDLDPERPETLVNLGILLAETGRTDEALPRLERAVKLAPESVESRLNLARALSLAGRWDQAIAQYDAALAHHPAEPSLRLFRAQALLEVGRPREAAAALGELIENRPDDALLRVREAQALVLAGDVRTAHERLEDGVRRLPQSGELGHALARLLLSTPEPALRQPARALALAEEVFAARPTVEHGETLAVALAAAGHDERARELTDRLLAEARAQDLDPRLVTRLEGLRRRLE